MKTITVTATEANRAFSRLLDSVKRGQRVEITSHGRKVAVISPFASADALREERRIAVERLKEHLAAQPHITVGHWTRDDVNERD